MKIISLTVLIMLCIAYNVYPGCGSCAGDAGHAAHSHGTFAHVAEESIVKDGVTYISYEQFMAIRNSGEEYRLLDVLPADVYAQGHIENAESFPLDTMTKETLTARLSKDDNIIVYCGTKFAFIFLY